MGDVLRLDPQHAERLHAAGVHTADDLLALGDAAQPRRFVGFVDLPGPDGPLRAHLKRYRYAGWRASLGLLGRGTLWGRAPELREYEALRTLRAHGLPAVRPLAACARRRGGRLVAHALLTRAAPADARPLEARLRDPRDPVLGRPRPRRALLRLVGATLRAMHAVPFAHRDLRARNILVGPATEGVPTLWLLDCRRGGTGGTRARLDDLASLDRDLVGRVPRGDRLAGLRAYLGPEADLQPFVARIAVLRATVPPPRAV